MHGAEWQQDISMRTAAAAKWWVILKDMRPGLCLLHTPLRVLTVLFCIHQDRVPRSRLTREVVGGKRRKLEPAWAFVDLRGVSGWLALPRQQLWQNKRLAVGWISPSQHSNSKGKFKFAHELSWELNSPCTASRAERERGTTIGLCICICNCIFICIFIFYWGEIVWIQEKSGCG